MSSLAVPRVKGRESTRMRMKRKNSANISQRGNERPPLARQKLRGVSCWKRASAARAKISIVGRIIGRSEQETQRLSRSKMICHRSFGQENDAVLAVSSPAAIRQIRARSLVPAHVCVPARVRSTRIRKRETLTSSRPSCATQATCDHHSLLKTTLSY